MCALLADFRSLLTPPQIRMPSGESMRERFPADAPLRRVVEHISERHPSLASFALLHSFPRKRFGETELSLSLHELGLTPNAALCIQAAPPDTPGVAAQAQVEEEEQQQPSPPSLSPPRPLPRQLWEEAVEYAGIPGMAPPLASQPHYWGKHHAVASSSKTLILEVFVI